MSRCTLIATSLVSGEPLSDGDRDHLATCADCTRLAAVPGLVAATAVAPEPGLGFASRVTAGAHERLDRRRRHRVVSLSLATITAAATAVVVTQRDGRHTTAPAEVAHREAAAGTTSNNPDPDADLSDAELRELVRRTSFAHAMAPAADWDDIEAPLQHYRAVLARGETP
jgi:hypothetical protein